MKAYVNIPQLRYEELIEKETRLRILESELISGSYTSEGLLRIIGSSNAVKKADEIRKRYEETIKNLKDTRKDEEE